MRTAIVEKAKEYLHTPFKHQGRLKGVGVDCIGLIICVYKDVGIFEGDFSSYSRQPHPPTLLKNIKNYFIEISEDELLPGDVILFEFVKGAPQHFALYMGGGYIIHSYSTSGGVVHHVLAESWRKHITKFLRFKEL